MVKFCSNCGNELNEGGRFCSGCGANHQSTNQNPQAVQYRPQQVYGYAQPNLLQRLSTKINTLAIIWLIVGIIQILFFIIILVISEGEQYYVYFVLVIGILNIFNSIQNFSYSKTILHSPVGIVAKYSPVGGAIFNLIYNILFGGLVGIIGSIYYFTVRSLVVVNSMQFSEIEAQFSTQRQ